MEFINCCMSTMLPIKNLDYVKIFGCERSIIVDNELIVGVELAESKIILFLRVLPGLQDFISKLEDLSHITFCSHFSSDDQGNEMLISMKCYASGFHFMYHNEQLTASIAFTLTDGSLDGMSIDSRTGEKVEYFSEL